MFKNEKEVHAKYTYGESQLRHGRYKKEPSRRRGSRWQHRKILYSLPLMDKKKKSTATYGTISSEKNQELDKQLLHNKG